MRSQIRYHVRQRRCSKLVGYIYYEECDSEPMITAIEIGHTLHPELFPLTHEGLARILTMFFGDDWSLDYSSPKRVRVQH